MRRAARLQGTWPDSIPQQGLRGFRATFKLLTEVLPRFQGTMLSESFAPYLDVRLRKGVRLSLFKGHGKNVPVILMTNANRWAQWQRRVGIVKKHLPRRRDRFDPLFSLFRAWAKAEVTPILQRHYMFEGETIYVERVSDIPQHRSRLSRSVKDITSLIDSGYTVRELVKLASMGDMDSLFRLIALDKCFLTAAFTRDWVWRMHSRDDVGFFRGFSKAVGRDTFGDHRRSVKLGVACYLLWFLGFGSDQLTNRELLSFLESEGIVRYPDPKSFDTALRRFGLRRYKMRQKRQ